MSRWCFIFICPVSLSPIYFDESERVCDFQFMLLSFDFITDYHFFFAQTWIINQDQ